MPSTISLLICTYRAPSSLDLLFDSLENQEWQSGDELIVVDNGVAPERASAIQERLEIFTARGIRAVYARAPVTGLTAARLTGFALVKAEWLVLLDDDNLLADAALAQLRRRIVSNPELGGICPRVEPVWEESPPSWVMLIGHDVLSYNSSPARPAPPSYLQWPGGKRGLRPPGGGMIVRRHAAEAFIQLSCRVPLLSHLGHRGAFLGSGEDYLLYQQIYLAKRPTAYDDSIVIRHMIPKDRMRFTYLCRLLYRANFGFALVALALLGKALFLPSIGHAVIRLGGRLATGGRNALSLHVLLAFLCAFAGYVTGTVAGLFSADLSFFKGVEALRIPPAKPLAD